MHIAAEAALDGIYVIRTSVSYELFDSPGTVRAYKSLSTVERAFRSYKTVDLNSHSAPRTVTRMTEAALIGRLAEELAFS